MQIKCGNRWHTYSLDLREDGPKTGVQELAQGRDQTPGQGAAALPLYVAYALSRQPPPTMRQSTSFELRASVRCTLGDALPDITIELLETPSEALLEQWLKGWRLYSICRGCLESCHSQPFTPRPHASDEAPVEKGTLCVGRSSGRYYFILCAAMEPKFLLPLVHSFRVVGRVTRNLSSLEAATRLARQSEVIEIRPHLDL